MILSRNIGVQILPVGGVDPSFFHELLARWIDDEFVPSRCERTLQVMLRDDSWAMPSDCFDPAAIRNGGFAATNTILYPEFPWTMGLARKTASESSVVWSHGFSFDPAEDRKSVV